MRSDMEVSATPALTLPFTTPLTHWLSDLDLPAMFEMDAARLTLMSGLMGWPVSNTVESSLVLLQFGGGGGGFYLRVQAASLIGPARGQGHHDTSLGTSILFVELPR